MYSLRYWLALCGLALSFALAAQQTVSGQVVDEDGSPLVGVQIYTDDNAVQTISDFEGRFTFSFPESVSEILFSYVGFETLKLDPRYFLTNNSEDEGRSAPANVAVLQRDATLDEVVVTALGLERSNRELGYAVQSIDNEELTDVQSTNFIDNLAGQFAGVSVTAGATGVGSTSRIVIRGESSFTNNNPLFVVDGIPINNNTIINETNEAAAGFQEIDFGNGAMEVNPYDVKEVTVLKGPSAAALYGTRAANGVILITTKTGRGKRPLGVSFNSSLTMDRPFQLPEYQNTFGQGQGGEFEFVDGLGAGISDNITYSYGPRLDAGINIPQFDSPVTLPDGRVVRGGDVAVHGGQDIPATPFVSRPDNVRNFYETGRTAINNLAFSAGSEMADLRLSLTDLRSDSYIPGVNLERKTVNLRLGINPTEKISIQTGLTYVNANSDNRPAAGYGSENINYDLTAWLGRQTDLEVLEDYWQPGLEGLQQFSYNYTFFDNPYFTLLENRNSFDRNRLFGFLSASYEFTEQLRLTIRGGMDYSDEDRRYLRNFSTNRFAQGAYAEQQVGFREINTDFLLDYRETIGNFKVNFLLGGNVMRQRATNTQSQALTLAQPGIFRLSNAASPVEIFDRTAEKQINSVYLLTKFNYKEWMFLDVGARADYSSALATPGRDEVEGFAYPSAALSFVASRAFQLPRAISFLQLRASLAEVGNDTDPYRTSSTFVAQTPFGGQPTFSEQAVLAQPDLLPEQTFSREIGADIRFADDRIALDLTYYDQNTENQILSLPTPLSSGYRQRIVNGGTVRTRGFEAILGLTPIYNEKFRWDARFNFSTNRATVEELPEGTERFTVGYSRVYNSVNQTVFFIAEEGGQLGDLWGTGYLRNDDGQFILTEAGNLIADNTLKKLGNANPDFMLGFANRFSFGNFSANFLLDWRQGGELVSRTLSLAGVAGQIVETEDRPEEGIVIDGVVNIGTEENPVFETNNTAISAESFYRSFYNRNHEENNVYDASYLKLREVSISYRLGARQLEDSFLRSLEGITISLIGRNLHAWSEIPHFDPEQFAIQGQNLLGGVEDMTYPSARSFGVNLNLEF
ncbi:SusC/RagA family TonB-linked outer membrane protein [Lewinellaceae bacterium SD302]|nr:SusC/RagA family TonB-linked outer membrane protein [Lewinellaceae bacterium SD302]